ncbi:hypothetical protein F1E19_25990 [Escherichia coli]|nr:hypothetical protein F1E19_25990 [Escherichia coli]
MRQQQDEPGRFSICSRQAAVVLGAYKGWTLFWKNYDRLPHIYRSQWRYQRRFILKRIWKRIRTG